MVVKKIGFPQSHGNHFGTCCKLNLLLDRLQLLGDGAREAAGRREQAVRARRAEANEMRAQHVSMLLGRSIRRSGFGLLN